MSIATKCTCGYSITGVCTSSVKECRQLRKENTQLPKEVVEEISEKAHELAMNNTDLGYLPSDRIIQSIENRVKTLATAYATKLHQANETIKVLTNDNNRLKGEVEGLTSAVDELKGENQKLKASATGWRPLLEKVLVMNEMWGDLPGDFINEVKTFLHGE